jgi:hypothetical protein
MGGTKARNKVGNCGEIMQSSQVVCRKPGLGIENKWLILKAVNDQVVRLPATS